MTILLFISVLTQMKRISASVEINVPSNSKIFMKIPKILIYIV